jgi:hypothetical protein
MESDVGTLIGVEEILALQFAVFEPLPRVHARCLNLDVQNTFLSMV